MIEYVIEERPNPTSLQTYSLFPDAVDIHPHHEQAVEEVFPFTRPSENGNYVCPKWVKSLLFKSNTISDVQKVIRFFNMGGETQLEKEHTHDPKLSYLMIEDVFLTKLSEYEFSRIEERQDDPQKVQFKIHNENGEVDIFHK